MALFTCRRKVHAGGDCLDEQIAKLSLCLCLEWSGYYRQPNVLLFCCFYMFNGGKFMIAIIININNIYFIKIYI